MLGVKRSFKKIILLPIFSKITIASPRIWISTNFKCIQKYIFSPINLLHLTCRIRDNFISLTPHSCHTMEMGAIIWKEIIRIYVENATIMFK